MRAVSRLWRPRAETIGKETVMKFPSGRLAMTAVWLSLTAAPPVMSQAPTNVVGDDLKALVSGRTWAFSQYGDVNLQTHLNIWDFRKDGSVCARSVGAKRTDKCADEGKWSIREDMVCWDLTWMGEAMKLKSACFSIKKVGTDKLEMRSKGAPEMTFAAFKVL
jgi:hypothetical protein